AFAYCDTLESVKIPETVVTIGYYAFMYCRNLDNVIIPNSVTHIGGNAFWGCSSLEKIQILSDKLESIDAYAFTDTAYYRDETNWEKGRLYLGEYLIKVDGLLEEISISSTICSSALQECYSLRRVTINGDYPYILSGLTNLEQLTIVDMPVEHSVIGYFGYENTPITLKTIVLREGVKIYKNSFAGISGITIYVEGNEKDLRWDDNFPGWNNGNTVVYGDGWIEANFFDHNGNSLAQEIYSTAQVIRIPYLKIESDAQYSYIVEGFDLDGDGIADTIPATSSVDINATAVVTKVVNNYTVTFYDGDRVVATMTLPYGATITLPENLTKTGYDFVGWYGYIEGMKVTGDVKINSKWQHHGEGHVYGEMVRVDATCEEQGFDKYTCTICGEWYGENYTDALGHNYTTSIVDATCIEDGYTLHSCECGDSYKDTFVDALGHSYGELVTDVEATCTTDGQGHKVCARCSDVLEESSPANGHEFTSKVIQNSTCEKQGTVQYECHCGHKVDETLPLAEHNYQKQYASKSFLEWLIEWLLNIFYGYEGNQAYYFKCSDCGHVATEEEVELSTSASVMAACVHKVGEFELVKDATCQETAVYGKKCSICGEMIEAKLGNTLGDHIAGDIAKENNVDATCTEKGSYDKVISCTECNLVLFIETIIVDALGHNYSAEATVPTCTEQGYTAHTCTRCSDTYVNNYVDAVGHTSSPFVVENRVEATCTADGSYDNVTRCGNCETELSRDTIVVPATGHSIGEWTVSTAPTCTETGEERRYCNNCDHYEANELAALGHDYSNGGSCALCGKLSDGAVTGIVAGSAVAVGGGGFSLFWFVIRKKRFNIKK
ncbi:MAG: leucine-rich repeat protein, partial [Clostridia bacterium]|nr:leucine-rich repeat protein [Clostridia bacterium]